MALHKPVSIETAAAIVRSFLRGSSIIRIHYWRTGWSLTFSIPESSDAVTAGLVALPFDVALDAAELRVTGSSSATDDDSRVAATLFSAVQHKVIDVAAGSGADLELRFDSGRSITVSGRTDPVDEVWSLWIPDSVADIRSFGQAALVQSYIGDLSADSRVVDLAG